MKAPRLRFSPTQLFSYSLFLLSAIILGASILLTMNVTVLKNWKLSVPSAEIHAGDTVTLVSSYTKLRDVTGKSVRYIECQNSHHDFIRYPLNEAVANRAAGTGGTGIVVKVPESIPDLPTVCKFTIAIEYDVYPWRKVNVSNSTKEFQLLPKRDVPEQVSSSGSSSALAYQVLATTRAKGQPSSVSSSSSNTTPTTQTSQSNTLQAPPTDGVPSSSERQLSPNPQPVDDRSTLGKLPLVGGVFNAIGL